MFCLRRIFMLKLGTIMIGSENPKALGEFYEKLLGKPDWAGEGWYGWETGNLYFMIGEHSEVKGKAKEAQRLILNFESRTYKKEYERVKTLGARLVKELYQMDGGWIATFADPDGNYFQIVSPWKM
jgi:predicted enzyme related to lactoylglutathione lyase